MGGGHRFPAFVLHQNRNAPCRGLGVRQAMSTNLLALLQAQAAARPDHTALIDRTGPRPRDLSFAHLLDAAGRGAHLLRRAGLQPGDRVLIFQPMSAALYTALGAIFQAGLTAVFIDPGMTRSQLERAAAGLAPRGFIATPRAHLLRLLSPTIRRIPVRFVTGLAMPGATRWARHRGLTPDAEIAMTDPDMPALITATSGSTGPIKFATRSHGFLRRQHHAIHTALAMPADAVVATTLPIFVLSFMASGVTTLLPKVDLRRPGAVKVAPLLREMDATRVSCLAASPAFLDAIARHCLTHRRSLDRLTHIYSGGAPVFPALTDRLRQIAPQATVTAVYGATEAEPIATLSDPTISAADRDAMHAGAGLLAGTPVPALDVRVVTDRWGSSRGPYSQAQWDAQELEPGRPGEIVVEGPHVLTAGGVGEDATLTKIEVEGRRLHRTGDAGYFDEQGRLWLLGRCMARLPARPGDAAYGRYPFAVETAVHALEEVRHAAVVTRGGRRILALELYAPQPAEWLAALQARLAWAQLDEIRVLDHLPVDKRHNAKIDYPALLKLL